jgi:hypothetical protein
VLSEHIITICLRDIHRTLIGDVINLSLSRYKIATFGVSLLNVTTGLQ